MKVKELMSRLEEFDGDTEVMIPDYWPHPAYQNTCNDIVVDSTNGNILLVHVEPNVWKND